MTINNNERLAVFQAQTENVRELERAWKHTNRQLNDSIRAKNVHATSINTKFLALLYCALAEATFSKLIHTPYGLNLGHISQIKKAITSNGVKAGWTKCAELTLMLVVSPKSSHVPNVRQKLNTLIDEYIFDPSMLRNKLAHGQWVMALNRENTAENPAMTQAISGLDVVDLYRKKDALASLASILEDMIESPDNAHFKFYWDRLMKIEADQIDKAKWTFAQKEASLFAKRYREMPSAGSRTPQMVNA
ncbi:hypothetical protein [Variovorax boronicumulans]|uniref:hypothetical protein n=1 Tax=Variovorax boronicumulans TaxID=436515 RepID=UPI0012FCE0EE|nr:hypothetical protein [Variovorax boronicumulans]